MRARFRRWLIAASAAFVALPATVAAQYLYLDSNADGVHDASDVVQPNGPTSIDVWLRTDAGRDGSPASCSSQDGELTIFYYEFVLRASNGTVSWGPITNRIPAFESDLGVASSSTEYHAGYSGGASLPPGLHHLATVTVSVATGTPTIEVTPTPNSLPGALQTAFGSDCSGLDFDLTLKLGQDWFDTDGLAFGGVVRHPPELQPIDILLVAEGDLRVQPIYATDQDGDPLTFSKADGPAFMEVTTVEAGLGSATGSVRLTPGFSDAGVDTGVVAVTDGERSVEVRFRIVVQNTNRPPAIVPFGDMRLAAGTQATEIVLGQDPDGNFLSFLKVAGPSYMGVSNLAPGVSGVGVIVLSPSLSEAGNAIGTVGLSDGFTTVQRSFGIQVTIAPVLETIPDLTLQINSILQHEMRATSGDGEAITFEKTQGPHFIEVSTIDAGNGVARGLLRLTPGPFDAGTYAAAVRAVDGTDEDAATFRVTVIDPNGSGAGGGLFESAFSPKPVPTGVTQAAIADFNNDGNPDIATINESSLWPSGVSILIANGAGEFAAPVFIPLDDIGTSVTTGDFDRDGVPDLAITGNYGSLSIVRGRGDGTFDPAIPMAGGQNSYEVQVGDWNADGWPDLAVVSNYQRLSIFLNRGDGTFEEPDYYPGGSYPADLASGDLDGDGDQDIVITNLTSNTLTRFLNRGTGQFDVAPDIPTGNGPGSVLLRDLDSDDHVDALVFNMWDRTVWKYPGTGDGGFGSPILLPGVDGLGVLVDVDGDTTIDLVAPDPNQGTLRIWSGGGDGRFGPVNELLSGSYPLSVTAADLNSDGRTDLIACDRDGSQICIHWGLGGGDFFVPVRVPVGALPRASVVGDWNHDALEDVGVLTSDPSALAIFWGDRSQMLREGPQYAIGSSPSAILSADVDRDGVQDFIVSDREEPSIRIFRGHTDGTFEGLVPKHVQAGIERMTLGDFNRDGAVDLVASPSGFQFTFQLLLMLGLGDGSFAEPIGLGAFPFIPIPVSGDFDGDGNEDIACLDRSGLRTLWGRGDGTFDADEGRIVLASPAEVTAKDTNRDGRIDLLVSFPDSNAVVLFRGSVSRSWDQELRLDTGPGGYGLSADDMNGDGTLDLAVSNSNASSISLLAGNPDGSFGNRVDFGTGGMGQLLATADVDGDARPDLVSLDRRGRLILLRNLGSARPNRPPISNAGGPYQGVAGVPVQFVGTRSSDPDGDALAFKWSFGDGMDATGPAPIHAYSSGGTYQVKLVVDDGRAQAADSVLVSIVDHLDARAFRKTPSTMVIGVGPRSVGVIVEPIGDAFSVDEIDTRNVWMYWNGSGHPDSIQAMAEKASIVSDIDGNGVSDAQIFFLREDLARLFGALSGHNAVQLQLGGALASGARFQGSMSLRLFARPNGITAVLFPNPLNPDAVLSFHFSRSGHARIDIFDASGRRVRQLLPETVLDAGTHEVRIDGMDDGGRRLASGIYFYRIQSAGLQTSGRIVMLK